MNTPLYGLYLAGGNSSRMNSPKWALKHIQGKSFLEYGYVMLDVLCEKTFVSTATKNPSIPYHQIVDTQSSGLLGGILTAHHQFPQASWLVLACDLPAVNRDDLKALIDVQEKGEAIAFKNPIDQVPEATATIYHPPALEKLDNYVKEGKDCARHALEHLDLHTLDALSPFSLQNVNYPSDYNEWMLRAEIEYDTPELKSKIEYYAKLKQEAGFHKKTVRTHSLTVAGLWEECRLAHGLSLKQPSVKPAANDQFVPWDYMLKDKDRIAFMPPFAGG